MHPRLQQRLLLRLVVAVAGALRAPVAQSPHGGAGRGVAAGQDLLELLAEILVEPGVQEGVVAGGGHGEGVDEEETQQVVFPVADLMVEIVD